jgi:hypothetical protein
MVTAKIFRWLIFSNVPGIISLGMGEATRIMLATVPHVTSGSVLTGGFLLD